MYFNTQKIPIFRLNTLNKIILPKVKYLHEYEYRNLVSFSHFDLVIILSSSIAYCE